MKTTELNGPPPFLQGVYVQENFDFDKCGSALSEATDLSEPDIPPEDTLYTAPAVGDDVGRRFS